MNASTSRHLFHPCSNFLWGKMVPWCFPSWTPWMNLPCCSSLSRSFWRSRPSAWRMGGGVFCKDRWDRTLRVTLWPTAKSSRQRRVQVFNTTDSVDGARARPARCVVCGGWSCRMFSWWRPCWWVFETLVFLWLIVTQAPKTRATWSTLAEEVGVFESGNFLGWPRKLWLVPCRVGEDIHTMRDAEISICMRTRTDRKWNQKTTRSGRR